MKKFKYVESLNIICILKCRNYVLSSLNQWLDINEYDINLIKEKLLKFSYENNKEYILDKSKIINRLNFIPDLPHGSKINYKEIELIKIEEV